jgi:RNA polymerase sigma-70 factor (ECF subfamily)
MPANTPMPTATIVDTELDEAVAVFAEVRPRLHAIAARILHNDDEADDIVQDAWLRWQFCDRAAVENPTAFLVTMTKRLAINSLNSARSRREYYVGDWLTEPVDPDDGPTMVPEHDEALEHGVHYLLEHLSSVERAAFVLRQALEYPYEKIASILHLSEANTRQIVSRAGRRLNVGGDRAVDQVEERRLVSAFAAAARRGELDVLEQLLAA